MKKTIFLLLMFPLLFIACGSDDDDNEPKQDYTSFTIKNGYIAEDPLFGIVVGWQDAEGYWHRIDSIGDIEKGKTSKEVRMKEYHSPIGIFGRIRLGAPVSKLRAAIDIKENIFNKVEITSSTPIWDEVDPLNSKQFPKK